MKQRPAIYLCGPIHGLTYNEAGTWRDEAERLLAPEFDVLNPLSGRCYADKNYRELFTDAEIVIRDMAFIRQARAVLRFYEGASSEGSAMETFYATNVLGIPVITFGTSTPREELSLWLRHFTVKNLTTLEDAVLYLKHMWLQPHEVPEQQYTLTDSPVRYF